MIVNHLRIALRLVRRHKVHTAINIMGLALAMAVSIIILLYVHDDLIYEQNHADADRIYRVYRNYPNKGGFLQVALTPQPLAADLKQDLVEIEDAVTVSNQTSAWVHHDNQWQKIEPVHYTDPSFFRIFSFAARSGKLKGALSEPRSAVITASQSKRIFGEQNPIGKTITLRSIGDVRVTAVIEDPRQSHLRLGLILPMDLNVYRHDIDPKWINNFTTYILAGKYENMDSLRSSVAKYTQIYWGPETTEVFQLQALQRIWLHSDFAYDFLRAPYDVRLDYLMLTVVFSILAMACCNYINIETARAGRRAGEVALRKALGANRRQLITQFLGEACALCLLALFLAVILVEITLPAFNRFVILKELKLFDPVNMDILLVLFGTALATGLAAGSYPALLLAAIHPAYALKKISPGLTGGKLRQVMVVVQFTISILLITTTLVLAAQLDYLCNRNPGYDPNQLVCARMTDAIFENYDSFKADLLRHPEIISVTAARDLPTWRGPSIKLRDWEGKKDRSDFLIYHGSVDRDFIEAMRIELAGGISFAQDNTGRGLIINQAAATLMGLSDPLGKNMAGWQHEGRIIGVVKDYYYNNMREQLEPLVLKVSKKDLRFMLARISPEDPQKALTIIEQQWRRYEPDLPANLSFLEKLIRNMYLTEDKLSKLFSYAAMIAIWISCLGLYGLTTFIAAQRSKEIAIRKSYGASTGAIVQLLAVEHLKLALVANLIAWPLGWFATNRWLSGFAQRIQLGWPIFSLAAGISIGVVLITVSYKALKTASANPVEALRYE